jgi:hypothetical protein
MKLSADRTGGDSDRPDPPGGFGRSGQPGDRWSGPTFQVVIPLHCEGCGLTVHPAALRHDLGYVVAWSCPRCAREL